MDLYEIWGTHKGDWEIIDESDTEMEANQMLIDYRIIFGSDWRLEVRHIKQ